MKIQTHNNLITGFGVASAGCILFLLLLFFLQLFSASQSALMVKLPVSNANPIPANGVYIVITMDGKFFVNRKDVTKVEIEPVLQNLLKNAPSPTIVIAADAEALHGDVIYLMEIAAKNKYKTIIAVNSQK